MNRSATPEADEHDCSHVQLRASAEGHALYEQLGFNTVDDAHMVWMPPTA
ncbi:hypothetical protein [Streptomyces malaysiensis]|nr:hypothetical protein [Streptomyces malaysiensis]